MIDQDDSHIFVKIVNILKGIQKMIICAAIKDKETGAVFGGIRHGFIYSAMKDAGIPKKFSGVIEGFLDQNGHFYNRKEAFEIAINCGQLSATTRQLKREKCELELYSEDLY